MYGYDPCHHISSNPVSVFMMFWLKACYSWKGVGACCRESGFEILSLIFRADHNQALLNMENITLPKRWQRFLRRLRPQPMRSVPG